MHLKPKSLLSNLLASSSALHRSMDRFVILLASLLVAVFAAVSTVAVGSHAPLLPAEVYWQKVLPNVPMPSAIQDLLHPDRITVNVNNKNYAQNAGNLVDGQRYYYGKQPYAGNLVDGQRYYYGRPPYAGNLVDGQRYYYGRPPHAGKKSHHFHNDSNMSLFFLEKDLQPGAVKSMQFVRNVVRSTFIPRQEADSLPFSSAKLPEILNHFSIKPDTVEAANIRTTLSECEMPEFQGEHKFCVTSLESLVESSMAALGTRNVQAVSTVVSNEGTPKQPYTVAASGLKRLPGSETVACHSSHYPYVVYYCHSIKGARAYRVSLTGKSGMKVDAVAVCHTETDNWNPELAFFQLLNVKPGAVICHILAQDNLLWTPNK